MWNITSAVGQEYMHQDAGPVTISSTQQTDGTKQMPAHCLEVNGCNYSPGAHVDTSFGCKSLPKQGNQDKCAANMAWEISNDGAIKSLWDPTLCFEVMGGGSLSPCDGSRGQSWTIKQINSSTVLATARGSGDTPQQSDEGLHPRTTELKQLVSGSGFGCLSNGPPADGPPAELTFDISGLGWDMATATDLWSGADAILFAEFILGFFDLLSVVGHGCLDFSHWLFISCLHFA